MGVGAVIGSVVGGLAQARAAKRAARAQENAANRDIAFQTETRDIIRNDLAPYRIGGLDAMAALDYELGLRGRPVLGGLAPKVESVGGQFRVGDRTFATREDAEAFARTNTIGGTEYGGFTATPGYDFRLREGQRGIEASAAARGGLYSGATMKSLQRDAQNFASAEYNNYLNRLAGRADSGLSAAQMSGAASQNAAAGVSQALAGIGNARAAGAIGVGNAITGGIQNALGAWNYMQNLKKGQGGPGSLFGGNSWGRVMTGAEWLRYSNQGAIRNKPLDPRLVDAMSFLPELGITMDVISGGQAAKGQGPRTGSTRHDHGMAADVDFYKDGRKLDWNNPADLPILTEIVRAAKARGVTGIGAGDDYMGAGRFHIGFGAPAVWGAGGKSANAPDWLREAYGAAPAGSAPPPAPQPPGNMLAAVPQMPAGSPQNALAPQQPQLQWVDMRQDVTPFLRPRNALMMG